MIQTMDGKDFSSQLALHCNSENLFVLGRTLASMDGNLARSIDANPTVMILQQDGNAWAIGGIERMHKRESEQENINM
jgi:hypothetical protein